MRRPRFKRWCWLLVLGLTPQLGCVTLKDSTAATTPPAEAPPSTMQLPDAPAEKLCLMTAAKFEETGHYEDAAMQLEKARARNPKLDVTHRLALLYEMAEKYPEALAEYNRELATKPNDANLLNDIGVCLYKKSDWVESEKKLRRALELNPKHAYAWGNLGQTLAAQDKLDESLAAFKHTVTAPEAFCNVAFVQASQGKLVEARVSYHRALELDPQNLKAQKALQELDTMDKRKAAKQAAAPTQGG